MSVTLVSRREVLAALGIGAGALTLRVGFGGQVAEAAPAAGSANAFVSIAPSGVVSIVCHRSEMGQGVRTAMPMIVADELGADWSKVKVVQGDSDPIYGDQNTDGSRSVRRCLEPLRRAGAAAREMLVAAAARRWRVRPASCVAKGHRVVHRPSGRSLGFGELAAEAAESRLPDPASVRLKPAAELELIGTSPPIVDGAAITSGAAVYGADVRLPGMLTGLIERPPAPGDEVARLDDEAARAIPGVRHVFQLPTADLPCGFTPLGGVAVLADDTWTAMRGRRALSVEWRRGRHAGYDSKAFRRALEATVERKCWVARDHGDADAALGAAARVVSARYYAPHLAQAPMEPPVAVAHVSGKRCEIWASTQAPQTARQEVAGALGLERKDVTVHVTLLGGGFGRKSKPDFIVEAALLSRRAKRPVRLQWTRTDDLRHGYYHSVSAQRLDGGFDASGRLVAWRHRTAFPSIGATFGDVKRGGAGEQGMGLVDVPWKLAHIRAEVGEAEAHVRIGWMRSVANVYHAFAVGSFVDELAAAASRDPRDFWLELLGPARRIDPASLETTLKPSNYGETDPAHHIDTGRLERVIETVCRRSGWSAARRAGRALGLAAHRSFASYVATVIEVERGAGGVSISRAHSVIDCGQVVHPERVRSQLEGAVIFGLSNACRSAITAKGGRVEQSNFHDYPVLRINEAPRVIDVHAIDSDAPPGGVGEPGVPPVAPALANALFAATRKRQRSLPLAL